MSFLVEGRRVIGGPSRLFHRALEVAQVVVAVERLGRVDVGMAKHPLHDAEIPDLAPKLCRERVPSSVHIQPDPPFVDEVHRCHDEKLLGFGQKPMNLNNAA